jgi:peptide/nickel transport system ATP-binding protein
MTVDIHNLTLKYALPGGRSVRALTDVSLKVDDNEILGIVGESGCGKSTLAYTVIQVLPKNASITEGKVLLDGRDLLRLSERKLQDVRWTKIAMVFQSSMNAFSPVHRILDQLAAVHMTHLGSAKAEALRASENALVSMGIPKHRVRSYPHEFSGGMRQRSAIALALLLDPEVLITDEPTTALDVVVQDRILKTIEDWQVQNGRSVVFISHDIAVVSEVCDRIAVMYGGQIVELADTAEILSAPRHPYTDALLRCVPSVRGVGTRLATLSGSPPDLSRKLIGCPFRPRCTKAFAECERRVPGFYESGLGHLTRCFLYDTELT